MVHLIEAYRYLKVCIQKGKKKFQRLEEAQDTPTAWLCEGVLQTFSLFWVDKLIAWTWNLK